MNNQNEIKIDDPQSYIDAMLGNTTNNDNNSQPTATQHNDINLNQNNATFTLELDNNNNQVNLMNSPQPPANFVQTESDSSSTHSSLT